MPSLAEKYDFGLFETGNLAPELPVEKPIEYPRRRISQPVFPKRKSRKEERKEEWEALKTRVKRGWKKAVAYTLVFGFTFGSAALYIKGTVEITELTSQIEQTTEEIRLAEAYEQQLSAQLNIKFNSQDVEEIIKYDLGMRPIQKSQVQYINTVKQDVGTVYAVEDKGWFDKAKEWVLELLGLEALLD